MQYDEHGFDIFFIDFNVTIFPRKIILDICNMCCLNGSKMKCKICLHQRKQKPNEATMQSSGKRFFAGT